MQEATARLLVLDDDPSVRVTVAANLELAGFEVLEAGSIAEAVEVLRKQRVDIVISDVRMPGKDGVTGLDDLRQVQPDVPAIFITGYDADGVLPRALAKGAYTVLSKPVKIEHLVDVVRRGLGNPAVLAVDDDPLFLDALVEGLRAAGLRVAKATDRNSTLDVCSKEAVDVCVLDLILPKEDGVTVLAELRESIPDIRIIAMTGQDVGELVRDVMKGGAYHCLRKPFEIHVLTKLIGWARSGERAALPRPSPDRAKGVS